VLAADLPGGAMPAFASAQDEQQYREEIEHRAEALGLQQLRWPAEVPFDSGFAMRAATYARSIGRTVPFAQAAFRQAFAGGRSLADEDSVLIAAAACEMHPAAVLRGAGLRSIAEQLARETASALREGVRSVPAVMLDGVVYEGHDAIERAAGALEQA
jgi:2-hydroxychromene-2-carboxylate isomerase